MSNKVSLIVLLVVWGVLAGCISWLVVVDQSPRNSNGLECVYNCDGYNVMLESLKPSNGLKMSLAGYGSGDLQPAVQVQYTEPVQLTIGGRVLNMSDKLEF